MNAGGGCSQPSSCWSHTGGRQRSPQRCSLQKAQSSEQPRDGASTPRSRQGGCSRHLSLAEWGPGLGPPTSTAFCLPVPHLGTPFWQEKELRKPGLPCPSWPSTRWAASGHGLCKAKYARSPEARGGKTEWPYPHHVDPATGRVQRVTEGLHHCLELTAALSKTLQPAQGLLRPLLWH